MPMPHMIAVRLSGGGKAAAASPMTMALSPESTRSTNTTINKDPGSKIMSTDASVYASGCGENGKSQASPPISFEMPE